MPLSPRGRGQPQHLQKQGMGEGATDSGAPSPDTMCGQSLSALSPQGRGHSDARRAQRRSRGRGAHSRALAPWGRGHPQHLQLQRMGEGATDSGAPSPDTMCGQSVDALSPQGRGHSDARSGAAAGGALIVVPSPPVGEGSRSICKDRGWVRGPLTQEPPHPTQCADNLSTPSPPRGEGTTMRGPLTRRGSTDALPRCARRSPPRS